MLFGFYRQPLFVLFFLYANGEQLTHVQKRCHSIIDVVKTAVCYPGKEMHCKKKKKKKQKSASFDDI